MTLTAPPVVEPRFVWVRYEPAPEPDADVPEPRSPQDPAAPRASRDPHHRSAAPDDPHRPAAPPHGPHQPSAPLHVPHQPSAPPHVPHQPAAPPHDPHQQAAPPQPAAPRGPEPAPAARSRAAVGTRPRAHRPDRLTPLVPGSLRSGAREAAARRRAEIVVRIALEVLDGRRPVAHLAPYAAPEVLRYVAAGVPGRSRDEGAPTLRSLHCAPVGRTAAEVAALCRFGPRFRALAARLDLTPTGDWRCTTLRVL